MSFVVIFIISFIPTIFIHIQVCFYVFIWFSRLIVSVFKHQKCIVVILVLVLVLVLEHVYTNFVVESKF